MRVKGNGSIIEFYRSMVIGFHFCFLNDLLLMATIKSAICFVPTIFKILIT